MAADDALTYRPKHCFKQCAIPVDGYATMNLS